MTKRETVNRNIGLTFDFIKQVINEPTLLDKIPDDSVLEFIEKDFVKEENSPSGKEKLNKKYLRVHSKLEII